MRQGMLSCCVAVLAAAAFFWAAVLSASTGLHERIHVAQGKADHSCAVTFLGSGCYHDATGPALGDVTLCGQAFGALPELSPCWVQSPFLNAAIFDHGPP